MNILVLGGTRFFGICLVQELLSMGHHVTIATRGQTKDSFGDSVQRIEVDRNDLEDMQNTFKDCCFDLVYDHLAYSSQGVKIALDSLKCDRYILISSTAVYQLKENTSEIDFIPQQHPIIWGERNDFVYDEGKRQAEAVLIQKYPNQKNTIIRFPVVLSEKDYTKRLLFYVEHIQNDKPMSIDNLYNHMCFIHANEVGKFLAFLTTYDKNEIMNVCSLGSITIAEIIDYIEKQTGHIAVLNPKGDKAPYNGIANHSIQPKRVEISGFQLTNVNQWIYPLLDYYINL